MAFDLKSARYWAQALIGEDSGTRYAMGDMLELRLGEANPLTGALKFEIPGGEGAAVEPRGAKPRERAAPSKQGKYTAGKRGRPANIRHQGRGKKR